MHPTVRMLADFRYAVRTLRQNPGFALVAILSLALGIGAAAAAFSSADALVLRPMAVPDASGVIRVHSLLRDTKSNTEGRFFRLSYPDYADLRDRSHSFAGLTAAQITSLGFAAEKGALAEMKSGEAVSGNFFAVLGVPMELGRGFRDDEDQVRGRDAVAVLSHEVWQSAFAASREVLGRTIFLNGIAFTVVGVVPDSFLGSNHFGRTDIFVPLAMAPRLSGQAQADILERRDYRELMVRGRLRPGVGLPQAAAEVRVIGQQLATAYPATNREASLVAFTDRQSYMEQEPLQAAFIVFLLSIGGVVLLIACANVTNLMLVRARARSREIAVRLAIGAGRFRLIRQLLMESLVIATIGGALGLLVAQANADMFSRFRIPSDPPLVFDVRLDARVVLFTLLVTLASVLLCGIVPAFRSTRLDLVPALKSGKGDNGKGRRFLGRNTLVVAQVAGSLVLLVFASQIYRGFTIVLGKPPGFRVDHLLAARFNPSLARYAPAQTADFYKRLLDRSRTLPGVTSAALAQDVPMGLHGGGLSRVSPEGFRLPAGADAVDVMSTSISDDYFRTLGIPIVEGREFQVTDRADSPRVAIVNELFAKHYYPNGSALGKRFRLNGSNGAAVEIVGVAKQSHYTFVIESPMDYLYLPMTQSPENEMAILLGTAGPPADLAPSLRGLVRSLDATQPVFGVHTMDEFFEQRVRMAMNIVVVQIAGMGSLGLALALIGLYGLVTYSVGLRQREIGIRMAVGADSASVLRLILKHGMLLASTGVVLGLLLSVLAERPTTAAIGSAGFNLPLLAMVSIGLLAVTGLGAFIPARRAARLDPNVVLRQE